MRNTLPLRLLILTSAALLLALGLMGCACSTPAPGFAPAASCASCAHAAQYVPFAAPAAAAPCAVAAAPAAAPGAVQIPVQMKVGGNEMTRAALGVPGNVVKCFGDFLHCSLQALWPSPTPGLYVVPQATGYVQYAPPAAAPAPQAVQYVPVAAPPCAPAAAAPCATAR